LQEPIHAFLPVLGSVLLVHPIGLDEVIGQLRPQPVEILWGENETTLLRMLVRQEHGHVLPPLALFVASMAKE
jgi:hypothetical protein